jgi:hypothetical protein
MTHPDLTGNPVGGMVNLAFKHSPTANIFTNLVTGARVNPASIIETFQLAQQNHAYVQLTLSHIEGNNEVRVGRIHNVCRHCDNCLILIDNDTIITPLINEEGELEDAVDRIVEIGISLPANKL